MAALLSGCSEAGNSAVTGTVTSGTIETGILMDARDGHVYRTTHIGTQWWMAQNLDFDTLDGTGGRCYDDSAASCESYGRLYTWNAAMALPDSFQTRAWKGSFPHRGICPEGWHVPSDLEWHVLLSFLDSATAATELRSSGTWRYLSGEADPVEFAALPAGDINNGISERIGYCTDFWSSSSGTLKATSVGFCNGDKAAFKSQYSKNYAYSLRCVRDP